MKIRNKLFLIGSLVIVVAIGFLVWLGGENNQIVDTNKRVVIVFDGSTKIANVEVDSTDNSLKLKTLVDDDSNIDKLTKAVEEIDKRPALKVMTENERLINGVKSFVMEEIPISKTDQAYIYAVEETLSSEFGFETELENISLEKMHIDQGTVGTLGDVNIGVASVSKSEYADDEGIKKEGLVAFCCKFITQMILQKMKK